MFCLECTPNAPGLMMLKSYFLLFECPSAYLAFRYFVQVFPANHVHVTTRTLHVCFGQPQFGNKAGYGYDKLRKCNWLDVKQREKQWQQLYFHFYALHGIWIIMLVLDHVIGSLIPSIKLFLPFLFRDEAFHLNGALVLLWSDVCLNYI